MTCFQYWLHWSERQGLAAILTDIEKEHEGTGCMASICTNLSGGRRLPSKRLSRKDKDNAKQLIDWFTDMRGEEDV